MRLLLIDSCDAVGTLALADTAGGTILAAAELPNRSTAERLVPAIKALLAKSVTPLTALGALAIVHGPGSFTGVRVGVSAAKGLAEACQLPLVAVSRLAVLASLAGASAGEAVFALLDAGRGEFYLGEYVAEACGATCEREALVSREQVFAAVSDGSRVVVCEASVASALAELNPHLVAQPSAADALPLAMTRIAGEDFDDPATLDANYLRRTDAELFARPRLRPNALPDLGAGGAAADVPGLCLRSATKEDIDAIVAIERASDTAPHWPRQAYEAILAADEGRVGRCLFVAEVQGGIVGFAVGQVAPGLEVGVERIAELESVAVGAEFRRKGIGRALCAAVVHWSRTEGVATLMLEVRAGSDAAIRLYKSLGLTVEGRRKGYYSDPAEDALLMRLELAPNRDSK